MTTRSHKTIVLLLALLALSPKLFGQDTLRFSLQDEHDLRPVTGAYLDIEYEQSGDLEGSWPYTTTEFRKGKYQLWLDPAVKPEQVSIVAGGYDPLVYTWAEFKALLPTISMPRGEVEEDVVSITDRFGEKRERVAGLVKNVTSKEVALMNPQTSADLLQQTGDVFVQKSQMGGGSPNLRGFEANKVLIVVDGVRLNNAIFRGGHLQNVIGIDANMLEKVEVLFGPGSVMYGSDALGGVMHFYTRNPKLAENGKTKVQGNAFTRYSSANNEKTGHVDLGLGWKRFGMLTSATFSDFGDLRSGRNHPSAYPDFGKRPFYADRINGRDTILPNDDIHVQRFSGYSQWDLFQKFYLQHEKIPLSHTLNLQFSNTTDVPRFDRLSEVVADTSLKYASWYYGPQKRLSAIYRASAGAFEGIGFFTKASLSAAYQQLEESRHTRRFGRDSENHRFEQVRAYSFNLDFEKKFSARHSLDYGAELVFNQVASTARSENINTGELSALDTRYPDGGSAMRMSAIYIWDVWDIVPDVLTLNTGIRFNEVYLRSRFDDKTFFPFLEDQVEQQSIAPSGSVGISWRPTTKWRIRSVLASGFRAPNVDDVGKTFDSQPGTVIVPNPGLGPEYTYNADLGIFRQFGGGISIEATGFGTLFDNALVVRDFSFAGQDSILYDGVLSRVQANQNAKQAVIGGFNLGMRWDILKGLRLEQTLTYTKGRDLGSDVPLDHIPPLFGRTMLRWEWKRLEAQVFALYNGWKRIEDYSPNGEDNQKFATADGMPAWYTLNFRGTIAITKNFKAQLGVENILDRHYRVFASGISAPGRNYMLNARFSF